MEKDGKYGNLQIDLPQPVEKNRLVATWGGSIMMDKNVDSDLIDLLTKRMEIKRKYSNLSQYIFRKLTNLSGLQPRKRSKTYNNIKGGCIPTFYNSPDHLMMIGKKYKLGLGKKKIAQMTAIAYELHKSIKRKFADELHKSIKRKFQKRPVIVVGIDEASLFNCTTGLRLNDGLFVKL